MNGLGVTEPLVQLQGENRIIVELPGIDNPDQAVQTLKSTGQLEFVEIGSSTARSSPSGQGVYVRTTNNDNDARHRDAWARPPARTPIRSSRPS